MNRANTGIHLHASLGSKGLWRLRGKERGFRRTPRANPLHPSDKALNGSQLTSLTSPWPSAAASNRLLFSVSSPRLAADFWTLGSLVIGGKNLRASLGMFLNLLGQTGIHLCELRSSRLTAPMSNSVFSDNRWRVPEHHALGAVRRLRSCGDSTPRRRSSLSHPFWERKMDPRHSCGQ